MYAYICVDEHEEDEDDADDADDDDGGVCVCVCSHVVKKNCAVSNNWHTFSYFPRMCRISVPDSSELKTHWQSRCMSTITSAVCLSNKGSLPRFGRPAVGS